MMRERVVWIVALIVVAAAGFYSGQFIGVRNGQANVAQASQQFYSQRGGGNGNGQGGSQGQGGFAGRGVSGTVASVDGNMITVTTRNGQTETVQLADNGTVTKQVNGQVADITKGAQIVALGQANGDTFQATSIQIGGGFGGGRGGTGAGGGRGGNGNGAPDATSAAAP